MKSALYIVTWVTIVFALLGCETERRGVTLDIRPSASADTTPAYAHSKFEPQAHCRIDEEGQTAYDTFETLMYVCHGCKYITVTDMGNGVHPNECP